jgi:membrane-bound serine protease (ClpP class)
MMRRWLLVLFGVLLAAGGFAAQSAFGAAEPKRVVIIPIHDEIGQPTLYVIRRGLKEAIAQHADVVVLDLKTPGGALDATFDIMEDLEKFPGQTVAFVDDEAMSAGSFVSAVTDEIWFTPLAVIGAAAPVQSTGQDVDATMKQKIVSYLKARVRAVSEGKRYRGEVISAMIDSTAELKIDGQVLKAKEDGLLSLTASEAMKTYGKPPQPLLGAGIARDLDDLLTQKFGANGYIATHLEVTWSEQLAVFLTKLSPMLLGLGLLALFLAFKTQSFGLFGAPGIVLLGLVFFSSYVAGLSGHEPMLVFALGAVLLLLELMFFHSAGFLGAVGIGLIFSSLIWAMADLWPGEPLGAAWSANAFALPLANFGIGLALALILAIALLRFLPHGWIWDRLVVQSTQEATSQPLPADPDTVVGKTAHAVTTMAPSGYVVIDGRRYEAFCESGLAEKGSSLRVMAVDNFRLIVSQTRKPAKPT